MSKIPIRVSDWQWQTTWKNSFLTIQKSHFNIKRQKDEQGTVYWINGYSEFQSKDIKSVLARAAQSNPAVVNYLKTAII